jgi:hypothetical protein
MITFLVGSIMGLSPAVALPASIIEGLASTVIVSMLAERWLFPTPQD